MMTMNHNCWLAVGLLSDDKRSLGFRVFKNFLVSYGVSSKEKHIVREYQAIALSFLLNVALGQQRRSCFGTLFSLFFFLYAIAFFDTYPHETYQRIRHESFCRELDCCRCDQILSNNTYRQNGSFMDGSFKNMRSL